MVDFHTHILPGIDDGSNSVTESIEMLKQLGKQNIDRVVATPHYYLTKSSIDKFLDERENAIQKVIAQAKSEKGIPKIVAGAEVLLYPEISRVDRIKELCICGTNYMLLEMPFTDWSSITYATIESLRSIGIIPIIAHFERYINLQSDKGSLYELLERGCLIQMNSGYINSAISYRKALKYIKMGYVHFIGSDCHNTTDRSPNIGRAYEKIEKKLGQIGLERLEEIADMVLSNAKYEG